MTDIHQSQQMFQLYQMDFICYPSRTSILHQQNASLLKNKLAQH